MLSLFLSISGCTMQGREVVRTPASDGNKITLTQEELRDKLDQYQDLFETLVRRACDEILARDNSRRFKRLTLYWQMRILPMSRNALDQDNPVGSLLDLATLCIRQRQYLERGEGAALFGPHQEVAVQAAAAAVEEIERIAAIVFPPKRLEEARSQMTALAEEYPLRGEFSGSVVRVSEARREDSMVQSFLSIPMAPFRWLGGVDHTAQAIKGFTVVAARLTEVVDGLAADARLHAQLLLLEAEDLEAIRSSVDSVARLAESSERLARVAETLPENVRRELGIAFEDLESKQAEARMTIRETRELAERIDSAAQSLASAADAIGAMVAGFRSGTPGVNEGTPVAGLRSAPGGGIEGDGGDVRSKPAGESGFAIQDYTRMGESVEAAAKELRGLAGEIDTVARSEGLRARLDELDARLNILLADTETRAAAATDHAVWRLLQLALVVFVLAVVYRWLGRRFGPGRA